MVPVVSVASNLLDVPLERAPQVLPCGAMPRSIGPGDLSVHLGDHGVGLIFPPEMLAPAEDFAVRVARVNDPVYRCAAAARLIERAA